MEIKNLIIISALLSLCFLFWQCEPSHFHHENKDLGNKWHKDSTLNFEFSVDDTTSLYNIAFILRNNNEYEFSNLYLFNKFTDPKGMEITDTLQYYLAYPTGDWIGTGFNTKELKLIYRDSIPLLEKGKYTISIWHGMRPEELTGLEDISLIIDKVN